MEKTKLGALLLLILGALVIFVIWLVLPMIKDSRQVATSDAAKQVKGKIIVDLDNWIGYFPLRSPEMKRQMRQAGWILECVDDDADYAKRMQRLRDGKSNFAVETVGSYILNGIKNNYPGSIMMVIDESKGGDKILARSDKVANLDALKGKTNIRVAFTPDSPSHYMAKAVAYHFSVPEILPPSGNLRIETKGSPEALKKLLAGTTDVAILWEPDVSQALSQKGIIKIIGSEDTEKLIVDILLVNRKFSQDNPEAVKTLLQVYFKVLKKYRDEPALLRQHVMEETKLPESAIEPMLKGVRWVNLAENCEKWFGIVAPGGNRDEGLIEAIESAIKILVNAKDFSTSPIPDNDPRRLVYSAFLEDLFLKGEAGYAVPQPGTAGPAPISSLETRFSALDNEGWKKFREVGTLKVDPIIFQHGSSDLDLLAKETIDSAVGRLKHYPSFRIFIKGHTGTAGDSDENQKLSQERAEAVSRYLEVTYSIDPNRMRTVGYGGLKPLSKISGESPRAWQYRLPRVEIALLGEEY
jgi:outer membrane protein OmpA-like peptidoglycan-associated protein/ABC-type taurine transport system substrate-binding protein